MNKWIDKFTDADFTPLERAVLIESDRDEVGLWLLIRWVEESLGASDAEAVRHDSMQVATSMMTRGLIEPVAPYYVARTPRGIYEPWELSVEEAVARIAREWEELGRAPNIGDIVTFLATDDGAMIARNLWLADYGRDPGPLPSQSLRRLREQASVNPKWRGRIVRLRPPHPTSRPRLGPDAD